MAVEVCAVAQSFVRDTFATLVAVIVDGSVVTGSTFTVGHNPDGIVAMVGGFGPLPKRLQRRIIAGAVLVCTPHAIGSYAERGEGGVYANVPAKAIKRCKTLQAQLANDPRVPSSLAGIDLYQELVDQFQG